LQLLTRIELIEGIEEEIIEDFPDEEITFEREMLKTAFNRTSIHPFFTIRVRAPNSYCLNN
jgi:hypothetical protein